MDNNQQQPQQAEQLDELSQAWDRADDSRTERHLSTLDKLIAERQQGQAAENQVQPE